MIAAVGFLQKSTRGSRRHDLVNGGRSPGEDIVSTDEFSQCFGRRDQAVDADGVVGHVVVDVRVDSCG